MGRIFLFPAALFLIVCAAVFAWAGAGALATVVLLSALEVGVSFDNAVVNAEVLKRMNRKWRRRFLTWGILIAVVGVRLVLPILLVSATAFVSPLAVARLAFFDGAAYAALLGNARYAIYAFGAAFLLLLSLRFFFNAEKKIHWIRWAERRLASLGNLEALEIAVVLWLILGVSFFVPAALQSTVLIAGSVAVILSVGLEALERFFSVKEGHAVSQGLALFIYLEILDTAFSLDGVVGAFALTFSLPLIILGLGVGAYFVRTLTSYLVEHRILETLRYIEHGAYWAIFGLALAMFGNLFLSVPEIITGTIGAVFMCSAYYSSLRARSA